MSANRNGGITIPRGAGDESAEEKAPFERGTWGSEIASGYSAPRKVTNRTKVLPPRPAERILSVSPTVRAREHTQMQNTFDAMSRNDLLILIFPMQNH